MEGRSLPHYIRTHRKRAGLSQKDLAYLLGCKTGAKVSRYERFLRMPTLRSAIACSTICNVQIEHLFAGLYDELVDDIRTSAGELLARQNGDDLLNEPKQELLRSLSMIDASQHLRMRLEGFAHDGAFACP